MGDYRNDIYNVETKDRFLDSIDLAQYPPRWWERVFEKSYVFEKEKEKDLYSWTVPEILEFYKFLDVSTINPLMIYNINLRKYGQWALNESLIFDGMNHFDEIRNDVLSTCVNANKVEQSIISYDTFQDIIRRKIKNEQDKFIFYCLFEGIKGKDYQEIIDLKMADIDESKMLVHLSSGRDMYVPEEFINVCMAADKQTIYNGVSGDNREVALQRSITILKPKVNTYKYYMNRSVYWTIVRNIKYLDELSDVVTAKTIMSSGLIYYLNKRADKLHISVEELMYSLDNCRDILDKYNMNLSIRRKFILQYSDYLH